jgi:hypothetical protein
VPSAVARGSYYKQRSKRWLEAQGYAVAFLERVLWVQGQRGLVPVKKDQLGSDLIAVNAHKTLFVQVKGGVSARSQLAAARTAFAQYPLSPHDEQWIAIWLPRAREPEIEVCAVGPKAAGQAVPTPPRKRPRALPLFARAR